MRDVPPMTRRATSRGASGAGRMDERRRLVQRSMAARRCGAISFQFGMEWLGNRLERLEFSPRLRGQTRQSDDACCALRRAAAEPALEEGAGPARDGAVVAEPALEMAMQRARARDNRAARWRAPTSGRSSAASPRGGTEARRRRGRSGTPGPRNRALSRGEPRHLVGRTPRGATGRPGRESGSRRPDGRARSGRSGNSRLRRVLQDADEPDGQGGGRAFARRGRCRETASFP